MIFPKKEILYAPMLATFGGGSGRGWGRGGRGKRPLDWTFEFDGTTTLSNTGAGYNTLNSYYAGLGAPFANDTSLFNVTTLGYQDVLVTKDGTYEIEANGGSNGNQVASPRGARITAQFNLSEGGALRIIVGSGSSSTSASGGSFVFYSPTGMSGFATDNTTAGNQILVAAGGSGGGGGTASATDGATANLTTTGRGNGSPGGTNSQGSNGQGGSDTGGDWAGGPGAGLFGDGYYARQNGGLMNGFPRSYSGGFIGAGSGGSFGSGVAGFGGGAQGSYSSAGGGGYSGGSAQYSNGNITGAGGGGGSWVNITNGIYVANSLSATRNTRFNFAGSTTSKMGYVVVSPV